LKLRPLPKNIFAVIEMGERKIGSIVIRDDNGRDHGIRARWAKVWRVAEDIDYVKPGQWILVEHGRWSMTITTKDDHSNEFKFQKIDPNGIMCVSDEQPEDVVDVDLPV
jgi:hypothetical protein